MTLRILLVLLIAACSSRPPAPVVERSAETSGSRSEIYAEKDGTYRVRSGDSLWMIAFQFGLDHRQLARWNGIRSPYVIFPGQVLVLADPGPVAAAPPRERKPPVTVVSEPSGTISAGPSKPPQQPASRPAPASPSPSAPVSGGSGWQWPVNGRVLRGFVPDNPARNGYDIAGSFGQGVRAAAGGTVVYSGNGLIGYGELIIIKHDDHLLSAYAHNRKRLVAEGESVSRGQEIAEMGRNERNEAILHFEIRSDGRPVDPARYLPGR